SILASVYEKFNARDVDAVLSVLHPDVKWPNGWEGGYAYGREAVRDYWKRQWAAINPTVVPEGFEELSDGRVRVRVHQRVLDLNGKLLSEGTVTHTYAFESGKIRQMEIEAQA